VGDSKAAHAAGPFSEQWLARQQEWRRMLPRRTGLLSEKSVADFWVPTGSQHFIRSDACFQQSDLMNGSDPPAIRVCSGWAELGQRALNGPRTLLGWATGEVF